MQRNKISFKGQKIFIGIDVHKKNWVVAIASEVGMVKRRPQKTSAKELFDFLKKHYSDGDYLAVYESGFSGYSTYYSLKEAGIECMVIHAATVVDKVAHGEMTFRGNKLLGPMIIDAVWITICKDAAFGTLYLHYKERMKPQEAIVRIVRRISNIIFAILKNEK